MGIGQRLKSQTHRRQFHPGLKVNLEFFNQLGIGDLHMELIVGDTVIFCHPPPRSKGSVTEFREFFALTQAIDVLKLFLPHKVDAIVRILNGINLFAGKTTRFGNGDPK